MCDRPWPRTPTQATRTVSFGLARLLARNAAPAATEFRKKCLRFIFAWYRREGCKNLPAVRSVGQIHLVGLRQSFVDAATGRCPRHRLVAVREIPLGLAGRGDIFRPGAL